MHFRPLNHSKNNHDTKRPPDAPQPSPLNFREVTSKLKELTEARHPTKIAKKKIRIASD